MEKLNKLPLIISVRNTNKPLLDDNNKSVKEYNPATKQHDKIVFTDDYSNNIAIKVTNANFADNVPTMSVDSIQKLLLKANEKLQFVDKDYDVASTSEAFTTKYNGNDVTAYTVIYKPRREHIDYSHISFADFAS